MQKPLFLITGFLGSGKTTLLRELAYGLKKRGHEADVILNDFANADLDAATLESVAASVAPIAAGCACCESLDELVSLCRAAANGSGDALLIELNGTSDPVAVLEAFTLIERELPFFPRLQIGVVDARHWGQRGRAGELEKRQLETASCWYLSHADGVTEAQKEEVAEAMRSSAPQAEAVLVAELVDFLDHTTSSGSLGGLQLREANARPDTPLSRPHEHPVHRFSHQFTGIEIPLPGRVRRRSVETLLESLPESVGRAKVLVKLIETPGERWLFQRSGRDPISEPIPIPSISRVSPSLVCIGVDLDPDEIRDLVRNYFGGEAAALLERAQSS